MAGLLVTIVLRIIASVTVRIEIYTRSRGTGHRLLPKLYETRLVCRAKSGTYGSLAGRSGTPRRIPSFEDLAPVPLVRHPTSLG